MVLCRNDFSFGCVWKMVPIQEIEELLEIQGRNGNWNYSSYMCGLYNGLALALAVIENKEPAYRERPSDGFIVEKVINS